MGGAGAARALGDQSQLTDGRPVVFEDLQEVHTVHQFGGAATRVPLGAGSGGSSSSDSPTSRPTACSARRLSSSICGASGASQGRLRGCELAGAALSLTSRCVLYRGWASSVR